MQDRAESFRRRVAEANAGRPGRRRFSPELRAEALEYLESRRKEGAFLEAVSVELGVSKSALDKWRRSQSGASPKAKRFVRVQTAVGSEDLIFEAPSGHRIMGLTLRDAMQLVERFSS